MNNIDFIDQNGIPHIVHHHRYEDTKSPAGIHVNLHHDNKNSKLDHQKILDLNGLELDRQEMESKNSITAGYDVPIVRYGSMDDLVIKNKQNTVNLRHSGLTPSQHAQLLKNRKSVNSMTEVTDFERQKSMASRTSGRSHYSQRISDYSSAKNMQSQTSQSKSFIDMMRLSSDFTRISTDDGLSLANTMTIDTLDSRNRQHHLVCQEMNCPCRKSVNRPEYLTGTQRSLVSASPSTKPIYETPRQEPNFNTLETEKSIHSQQSQPSMNASMQKIPSSHGHLSEIQFPPPTSAQYLHRPSPLEHRTFSGNQIPSQFYRYHEHYPTHVPRHMLHKPSNIEKSNSVSMVEDMEGPYRRKFLTGGRAPVHRRNTSLRNHMIKQNSINSIGEMPGQMNSMTNPRSMMYQHPLPQNIPNVNVHSMHNLMPGQIIHTPHGPQYLVPVPPPHPRPMMPRHMPINPPLMPTYGGVFNHFDSFRSAPVPLGDQPRYSTDGRYIHVPPEILAAEAAAGYVEAPHYDSLPLPPIEKTKSVLTARSTMSDNNALHPHPSYTENKTTRSGNSLNKSECQSYEPETLPQPILKQKSVMFKPTAITERRDTVQSKNSIHSKISTRSGKEQGTEQPTMIRSSRSLCTSDDKFSRISSKIFRRHKDRKDKNNFGCLNSCNNEKSLKKNVGLS